MFFVKTQINFEAAHRLYNVNTFSKECRENIHGHSYKVTIVVGRDNLNSSNMVVDFKLLKKVVKEKIETPFDHACVLNIDDPLVESVNNSCKKVIVTKNNPTAEWMAKEFFNKIRVSLLSLDSQLVVKEVRVQETENNIAIYKED